jgi:hypothetical protein
MQNLLQDLRYGFRLFFRNPLFTLVSVLSLALGISANTVIFSVFNSIFLCTLPVRNPESLVAVFTTDARNTGQFMNYMQLSYPNYEDYRDQNQVFSGLVAQTFQALSLSAGGDPERIVGAIVTGNYFDVLGVKPAAGLFLRSLQNAQKINPGFESKNLLMISFDLAGQRYDEARGREYFRLVAERVAAIPQVRAAGLASAPLFGGDIMRTVFAEGQDVSDRRNGRLTALLRVSPGYFDAIHMPICCSTTHRPQLCTCARKGIQPT